MCHSLRHDLTPARPVYIREPAANMQSNVMQHIPRVRLYLKSADTCHEPVLTSADKCMPCMYPSPAFIGPSFLYYIFLIQLDDSHKLMVIYKLVKFTLKKRGRISEPTNISQDKSSLVGYSRGEVRRLQKF